MLCKHVMGRYILPFSFYGCQFCGKTCGGQGACNTRPRTHARRGISCVTSVSRYSTREACWASTSWGWLAVGSGSVAGWQCGADWRADLTLMTVWSRSDTDGRGEGVSVNIVVSSVGGRAVEETQASASEGVLMCRDWILTARRSEGLRTH